MARGAAKTAQVVSRIGRKKGRLSAVEEAVMNQKATIQSLNRRLREAKEAAQLGHDVARNNRDSTDDPLVRSTMDYIMVRIHDLAGL